jgi:DNA-binding transcriptional ArsR family regulator
LFSLDLIKLQLNIRGMDSLTALADPTRRQIVEMLSHGERAAGDIADKFAISAPAISQHLKVLREARLVQVRVEAQRRIYTIDPDGLDQIDTWLRHVRQFWKGRLDALEQELRGTKPTKSTRSKQ